MIKYILSFLVVSIPFFVFGQAGEPDVPPGQLGNPLGDGVNSLTDFVVAVLNRIVLPIGSVVVVFFIIYAGFLFVTARGNESKLEDAKKTLLAVVIGAAILFGSVAIAGAIKGTICQISPTLDMCNFVGPPAPLR
jgi:predicted transporter